MRRPLMTNPHLISEEQGILVPPLYTKKRLELEVKDKKDTALHLIPMKKIEIQSTEVVLLYTRKTKRFIGISKS